MRALAVIHNPVYGGAHNELLGQRAGLAAAGWELLALTSDEGGSGRDRLLAEGMPVLTSRMHRLRASPDPRLHVGLAAGFVPEVRALRGILRQQRIDLVQAHGVMNPHAAIAAHREGVAVCWHIYDMVAPAMLRRTLSPLVVRLADSVTTIGRALADAHPGVDRLGERLVVTSPPVDFERFRPDPKRRELARRVMGVGDADVLVGTVGNLFPNKGHIPLLAAVEHLAPAFPGLALRLLGAPSPAHPGYETEVRREIEARSLAHRTRVLDPGRRVDELLPGFDIFVMPSRSEGMPTTLLEAMGCGIPVVASAVGAVGEVVVDGTTGLLVPPFDVPCLTVALESLLSDPAAAARMGAAGRTRVLEGFGVERVVDRRLRAYALALAHRRSRANR